MCRIILANPLIHLAKLATRRTHNSEVLGEGSDGSLFL